MKKLIFILTLYLIATTALGHTERPVHVVFVNPGFESQGFWRDVSDTMSSAAEEFGLSLEILYSDRAWPTMLEHANNVLARKTKPDFLILVNEHAQAVELLQRANEKQIPTLMLLNDLTPAQRAEVGEPLSDSSPYWLGSVVPDNEIAGYEMARSLTAALPEKETINLLTLAGDAVTPASLVRLSGLDRALAETPHLNEQRRLFVQWSEEQAYRRVEFWIKLGEPLDAIWAANDDIAIGAIRALQEAGLRPGIDVVVAGLNWSVRGVEHVRDEVMTLTHGGHFFAGALSMVVLHDALHRDISLSEPIKVYFPMMAINQTNATQYLEKFSDGNWSQIDYSQFSQPEGSGFSDYSFTLDRILTSSTDN